MYIDDQYVWDLLSDDAPVFNKYEIGWWGNDWIIQPLIADDASLINLGSEPNGGVG